MKRGESWGTQATGQIGINHGPFLFGGVAQATLAVGFYDGFIDSCHRSKNYDADDFAIRESSDGAMDPAYVRSLKACAADENPGDHVIIREGKSNVCAWSQVETLKDAYAGILFLPDGCRLSQPDLESTERNRRNRRNRRNTFFPAVARPPMDRQLQA